MAQSMIKTRLPTKAATNKTAVVIDNRTRQILVGRRVCWLCSGRSDCAVFSKAWVKQIRTGSEIKKAKYGTKYNEYKRETAKNMNSCVMTFARFNRGQRHWNKYQASNITGMKDKAGVDSTAAIIKTAATNTLDTTPLRK